MPDIFINLTNHPSSQWSQEEKAAAEEFGHIIDMPFPNIPAAWSKEEVHQCAAEIIEKIMSLQPTAVLCQGEFTCCYDIILSLRKRNIKVLAACSERSVIEKVNDKGVNYKMSIFKFIQFREYI